MTSLQLIFLMATTELPVDSSTYRHLPKDHMAFLADGFSNAKTQPDTEKEEETKRNASKEKILPIFGFISSRMP